MKDKPQLSAENPQDAFTTEQAYQEYEQFVEMIKREGSMNTPCKKCNELNKPCCDEHSGKIAEPQLSAEMEKRFDEEFAHLSVLIDQALSYTYVDSKNMGELKIKDIKHFLATAIEEQRQELLSEVESWLDEMPVWIKIEGKYGYDPIHNKADISPFRQELRAKLNQLKGEK